MLDAVIDEDAEVALLAEGVDRNLFDLGLTAAAIVALLAEGVDRNSTAVVALHVLCVSPSSRRAWIEIFLKTAFARSKKVALLAEGVDRNTQQGTSQNRAGSRPPRGGRG